MKLATYRDGSRDGQLVLVSSDQSQAHYATGLATRMQQLLDDWNFIYPQLQELAVTLNHGRARHAFSFDPALCMAPLPRAAQLILATPLPEGEPLLRRAASDAFLGAGESLRYASEAMAADFEAGPALLLGDVPAGSSADAGLARVRLVLLAQDWCLRGLEAAEAARGQSPWLSRPATGFAPLAVTVDELGEDWRGGRIQVSPQWRLNGRKQAPLTPTKAMAWGPLIAQAARTRGLQAGSLMAALQPRASAEPLSFGDSIHLDLKTSAGQSLCGAIDMDLVSLHEPESPPLE